MIRQSLFLLSLFCIIGIIWSCSDAPSNGVPKRLDGGRLWRLNCVSCHGADGALQFQGAFNLTTSTLDLEQRILVITKGRNKMQAYEGVLDADQIEAVARYSMTFNPEL